MGLGSWGFGRSGCDGEGGIRGSRSCRMWGGSQTGAEDDEEEDKDGDGEVYIYIYKEKQTERFFGAFRPER